MNRLAPLLCIALICPATDCLAQESLRAGGFRSFEIPTPEKPEEAILSCPKMADPSALDIYSVDQPGIMEVAETDAAQFPLPEDDMDKDSLLAALRNNLIYWQIKPDTFTVRIGQDLYTAAQMRATTQRLMDIFSANLSNMELREKIVTEFKVYRSAADDGSGKVVITGYYEAEILASKTQDETNKFPIYFRPAELIKTTPDMGVTFDYGKLDENGKPVPFHSRAEISQGALQGRGLEMAWAAHPAYIMLLQIQGSGILRFSDGDFAKVGFDGANGWPFKSVQKLLMDCGEVPPMSFRDFIKYLSLQGEREQRLVDLNTRYTFFKLKPQDAPAYGAMGAPVTPGRSIAVDPKPIPLGITALMKSKRPVAGPDGSLAGFRDFTRFVTTQDTGSAIRGPGRIDLFWGAGAAAEVEASSMKATGEFFILIAK